MAPVYPVLAELFPDQGIDVGEMTFGGKQRGRSLDDKDKSPPQPITPVAPGSYDSTAIILLRNGRRTTGVDTLEAAKMAADRGVRIYIVGMGSVGDSGAMPEGMPTYLTKSTCQTKCLRVPCQASPLPPQSSPHPQ